jgi:hypothetical protein
VKQLKVLILAEWKRSRGTDPLPEIPDRLGYVRKLADKGTVMKKAKAKANSKSTAATNTL